MDFAFSALILDRAGELRQNNDWLLGRLDQREARVLILSSEGQVLIGLPDRQLLQLPAQMLRERFSNADFTFLGYGGFDVVVEDANPQLMPPLFALTLEASLVSIFISEFNASAVDLRLAAAELPAQQASVAAFARSLAHWQSRTRFCGRCGAPILLTHGGHRGLCTQPHCAAEFFPRTDAAMIALIHDGERCLLARQPSWPENRFSTLAGFLEPGESLEACVRREVFEEVGVHVGDCQYVASQPWPFPASLMVGFIAQATSSAITLNAEIAEARWFSAAELADQYQSGAIRLSPRLSISRHLIELWYRQKTGLELVRRDAAA